MGGDMFCQPTVALRMLPLIAVLVLLRDCNSLQSAATVSSHQYINLAASQLHHLRSQIRRSCETYCPDASLPRADSLSDPAPLTPFPPLIHHIRNKVNCPSLATLITIETGLPHAYVEELIAFGAVYLSVPTGKLSSGRKPIKATSQNTISATMRREKTTEETDSVLMTRVSRVLKVNTVVPKGSYCRVHVNPRRYREAVLGVDWNERVIYGSDSATREMQSSSRVLFVDKVAGVPVSSTVDNIGENMAHQVQLLLSKGSPALHLASRLDVCTSGVIPLARDEVSAAILSKAIADRSLGKSYLAICSSAVPLGIVRHCFRRKSKSHDDAKPTLLRAYDPTLLQSKSPQKSPDIKSELSCSPASKNVGRGRNSNNRSTNDTTAGSIGNIGSRSGGNYPGSRSGNQTGSVWQLAELEVMSCRQLDRNEQSIEAASLLNGGPSGSEGSLFECEIRLVTGRTHQIRLQLAALGAALIGDSRYSPVQGLLDISHEREESGHEESSSARRSDSARSEAGSEAGSEGARRGRGDPSARGGDFVGDGAHLMGPEPKRIGLQCNSLFFPLGVAQDLALLENRENIENRQNIENRKNMGNIENVGKNLRNTENVKNSQVGASSHRAGSVTVRRNSEGDVDGVMVSAGSPWWRLPVLSP